MRKRERFLLASAALVILLYVVQLVPIELRLLSFIMLFLLSYVISAWTLSGDVEGVEWFTIVPVPGFYAVAVALFYFLLPSAFFSKVVIFTLVSIGMYALYLTANIFSVAKNRTIQLLRAAHVVDLFFTLLTMALLTNSIFSFHFPFWINFFAVGLAAFPLSLTFLWSVELKPKIEEYIVLQAGAVALILAEMAAALSFLPTTVWWSAILLTSFMYTGLGVLHSKMIGRLFRNTLLEYVITFSVVLVAFFSMMRWK